MNRMLWTNLYESGLNGRSLYGRIGYDMGNLLVVSIRRSVGSSPAFHTNNGHDRLLGWSLGFQPSPLGEGFDSLMPDQFIL